MSEEKEKLDKQFNKLVILIALALVSAMLAYAVPGAPYLVRAISAVLMLIFAGLAIKCVFIEPKVK